MAPRKRGRPATDEYVSPREAAEIMTAAGYPVSGRTVARMCARHEIASVRPGAGRYHKILRTTVDDFLRLTIDTKDNAV